MVRPAGSELGIESTDGIIKPNFLDYRGGGPGISLDDLAFIRAIPGVAVAAPVSVVGYVTELGPRTQDRGCERAGPADSLPAHADDDDLRWPNDAAVQRGTATVLLGGDQPLAARVSHLDQLEQRRHDQPCARLAPVAGDPDRGDRGRSGRRRGPPRPARRLLEPLASVPTSGRGNLTAQTFDCGLDKAALAVLGTTGCVPRGR